MYSFERIGDLSNVAPEDALLYRHTRSTSGHSMEVGSLIRGDMLLPYRRAIRVKVVNEY